MANLNATLICPYCGHKERMVIPTNRCIVAYDCPACARTLRQRRTTAVCFAPTPIVRAPQSRTRSPHARPSARSPRKRGQARPCARVWKDPRHATVLETTTFIKPFDLFAKLTAHVLQAAGLLKAEVARVGQNDMVQHVDAHQRPSFHQPSRQRQIIPARRGIPRWVVVNNQDRTRNRSFC